MKLSIAWLAVAAPLFAALGAMAGIPNLGEQWKEVIPHLEAVINFLLVLAPLLGGLKLFRTIPSGITLDKFFRSKTGN